jgi:hypothetical protein
MNLEDPSALDALFQQVKEALAGKQFTRSGYSESSKVYMLVAAGNQATAVHDLFIAIGKYARKLKRDSRADMEEEQRKLLKALEAFVATVKV